ncbi:uncharacterized protein LOC124350761 [Daphnia pulicaria]|uniref:uncharacterized protein LOC124350761 n=1 Tax=Daphnia pulicaria TaxID=35523 RepID=UPI001EEA854F|nr:uncharacterized protein LOC124350761 [Daphnia pulicaria]
MMFKIAILLVLMGSTSSAFARINLHDGPLFSGATSFTLELETRTLTKPTPCFVTSGDVSQCRRKRGIEENPKIVSHHSDLAPSAVVGIEATPVPRVSRMGLGSSHRYNSNLRVFSSFDDASYYGNNYRQPVVTRGRNNVISVGDCGMSTVNFSEFLSCLGLDVQQTTTLTATFTETSILSTGYTTMTVLGCTPAGFPYPSCSEEEVSNEGGEELNDSTTEFNNNDFSTSV